MITLDRSDIDMALPLVSPGLAKYLKIQAALRQTNVASDRGFQKGFNGFYRVRRGAAWQAAFYRILERQKSRGAGFGAVLRELHGATGRVEASFASKLVATVDPGSPVIDSIVLSNVGLELPASGSLASRFERAVEVHSSLAELFAEYLATPSGRYLVKHFERQYPGSGLTSVKVLDLVLWRTQR